MYDFLTNITDSPLAEKIVLALFVAAFVVQVSRWIYFSRVRTYRFVKYRTPVVPGISVVVVVNGNHMEWVTGDMKELLLQDYPEYEVVAVNDCGGGDLTSVLQAMSSQYPRLKYTEIQGDSKFSHTSKLSKLIGIKAASYGNVMFFEPWCRPASRSWISETAHGFSGKDALVFGISLYGKEPKPWNKFIRSFSMMSLIRSSRAAVSGRPYLVSRTDFGFTKNAFFLGGGYNHLTTGYGDNDLYLKKLLKHCIVSFVPASVVLRQQPDSFGLWFKELLFSTSSYRFYPFRVKLGTFVELLSALVMWSVLFGSAVLAAVGVLRFPDDVLFLSAVLLLMSVREVIVAMVFSSLSGKFSEKGILGSFLVYDMVSPLWETVLAMCRRFGPPSRMW